LRNREEIGPDASFPAESMNRVRLLGHQPVVSFII
jgi:hypothetical protein